MNLGILVQVSGHTLTTHKTEITFLEMDLIKLQISIDASELLKKEDLTKLKIGLNNKSIEHKFVPIDQLHIPLLMLGEKKESELAYIESTIEEILSGESCFDLKLSGILAFPNQDEGRLLYVGVQNAKELRSLQDHFASRFFNSSSIDYVPNLPVVRLKNHRNVSDILSPYKNRNFGKLKVSKLILYQITSGGAYMTYKSLKTFSFP